MEDRGIQLMVDNLSKNLADSGMYQARRILI